MATSGNFWTDRTTDGTSSTIAFDGGTATLFVQGVPDGAEITFEFNKYGSNWEPLDLALNFDDSTGCDNFTLAACNLRSIITGGGSNMDISAGFYTI